jgi:L-aspartate oxidase
MTLNVASIHDVVETDVVIVGAGVAGLAAALDLQPARVHVVTKTAFGSGGSSSFAQGGMAAAVASDDSPALHAQDTVAVAGGLADVEAVGHLTQEGPTTVQKLLQWGVRFDRSADHTLALAREAAHSRPRILHARDATGAEIVRALTEAARRCAGITIFENTFACDFAVEAGCIRGVASRDASGRVRLHVARAVIVATGGVGRVYSRTTNPVEATGDGLAMAARAGARLADLEFVQFHPTALAVGADPMPLLTEALRGHGAIVVDEKGRRFLKDADAAGELAARDVVARAIARQLASGGRAFLDARDAVGDAFPESFPTVFELCRRHGIDPRRDLVPVAPAAHYHMGGVWVDANGRTSLPGLWACGEVASTGVHGANRLASNSLLEAVVFGGRVALDIAARAASADAPRVSSSARAELAARAEAIDEPTAAPLVAAVRETMWRHVGLTRNEEGLRRALSELEAIAARLGGGSGEASNLALCGTLIAAAALERRESRGSHFREDYPAAAPEWAHRSIVTVPSTAFAPAR